MHTGKIYGTCFRNDPEKPLVYGEVELINPPRQRLRGEPLKPGVEAVPVFCGFCGTDFELMHMGRRGELGAKFPAGQTRLINGHEGVVWVPSENRFAVVLIRGGDSFDPTRFSEDETYFEYGCDGADGIFCDRGYFNPDMLLHLPEPYDRLTKLPLSLAKRLVFSDPYACAVFQHERMCDIGEAQNFRVVMAKEKCDEPSARKAAVEAAFERAHRAGIFEPPCDVYAVRLMIGALVEGSLIALPFRFPAQALAHPGPGEGTSHRLYGREAVENARPVNGLLL